MNRKLSSRSAKLAAIGALTVSLVVAVSPAAQAASLYDASLKAPQGHGQLTISNGTRYVYINGVKVDFGTTVWDLAWSPDGSKAAFIDDSDNLVVSNPNGSGRVTVAKNPGGQAWSHPTWQVAPRLNKYVPAKNNLIFAVDKFRVSHLERISATAVKGKPEILPLNAWAGEAPLPQVGNTWPNGSGNAAIVYANTRNGEVYIRDDYTRQQGGVVTKGITPALSPDGEKIAFLRSVHGHDHLFEMRLGDKAPKDLTPTATSNYGAPAWSPDGKTIAAPRWDGVVTLPADGSAAPKLVSTHVGDATYRR
ncbi:hypothetical protein [Kitasatospora sp. GP82]|uniref:TolB family protein n=1 Tax=Kitasatospora sp. GP82 TaxID=3035089 RepID=UPI002476F7D7|nr:hypothetical protein [Kitasatospora sp. GP82]MDH6130232.1 hypothetical protein [Kitasatospora sp. GP82]